MNIFGMGGAELVLIIVIMLVVAGPKRMVKWAYVAGEYIGRLRNIWAEVVDVVQKEIDDAGLDVKLPSEPPTKQNIDQWVRSVAKPYTQELENVAKDVEATAKETESVVKQARITAREATAPATWGLGSGGSAKPKPSQSAAAPKTESATDGSPATSNFGSWGGASAPTHDPASQTNGNFGTWANPRKPGAPTEPEQGSRNGTGGAS